MAPMAAAYCRGRPFIASRKSLVLHHLESQHAPLADAPQASLRPRRNGALPHTAVLKIKTLALVSRVKAAGNIKSESASIGG